VTVTLTSGADARYGAYLLNLIGSVQANSDIFDRIVAFDLGLTPFQRRLLEGIRGVEVAEVPPFVPHWRQGRTWKTWIWTHVETDVLLWLDAGITVLRSLNDPLRQIETHGYFCVSQGWPLGPSIPSEYMRRFAVTAAQAAQVSIAAGIIGFSRSGDFYQRVIVPTFEDARAGLTLGYSASEAEKYSFGLDRLERPLIRDCALFRHEQTLLGIHFYTQVQHPIVNDVYKYGGWLTPRDHPEQLIWNHRRRGDFRYLPRVRYEPRLWPLGPVWGVGFYCRAWRRRHGWLFRPSTYVGKLKRTLNIP
jgi:hypothetical protein